MSPVELQSAAWGGGELRDPKGSQEQRLSCQVQPCRPIGSKPAGPKATPVASLRCGRLRPARLCEPQKLSPFVFGRSQRRTNIKAEAASKRRCASPPYPGVRADRYHGKLAVRSPPKPGKQLSPLHRQSQASCSAQRGSKTVVGFRARRTSTAQSTALFSAPCPPHCGSATAPPVPLGTRKMGMPTPNRRPLGFHFDFAIAKRAKSPFRRAGDGFYARGSSFFARLWLREETALGPGRPRVPAVGNRQPLPRRPNPPR